MSTRQFAEKLREVSLFSACSQRETTQIAKVAERRDFAAGQTMIEEGQSGPKAAFAYVILSGEAIVRRKGRKVTEVGPGATVGEMALFDDGERTASVVAKTDVEALELSRRAFKGIIDSTPSVAHKLLAEMSRDLRKMNRKLYG